MTTGEPVTTGTRFSAGSLTKSMVATAISALAETGRLSLDDAVAAYLPALRANDWAGRATVRDLLANRSGLSLRDGLEFGFADRKDQDEGALSRLVADAAATGRAGDYWSYTNVGWCMQVDVTTTANGLLISSGDGQTEALPLDERTFLTDPADPDNPTVTFGAFDEIGRPGVLYDML